ncbi:MAG: GGDEF domain-containing protein [Gammaproteobacteria bacterium]|jgi:diguanylate cyclase (GGDEF)-like protein|nr:GGDEF domain-containing protein [Gammaproteobacteria bacterium]MBU2180365.1 GGDEF domain-containing protein [Gammaproteobacteria bacterium]MBU2222465.1 GGDEF domain-containing protein [Gammaproteobacteria bacterium]MBU2277294.1 GGDEF domain-containing protein [Gammaproteobacteria bacterium]MBU2425873.1 GGDEF domain-containing protein [Gammaproteobacteria bacterium]
MNNVQREQIKALVVAMLLLFTVSALLIQNMDFTKSITLNHQSAYSVNAISDAGSGGSSIARLETSNGKLLLHCTIKDFSYAWPFCEINFDLSNGGLQGLDLKDYSQVIVWAKYQDHPELGLRVQNKNYDPRYSTAGDIDTLKFNNVEYYGDSTPYPAVIPLKNFQVPTWWLAENKIPIHDIGPEFHNVLTFEVATGSSIQPGDYVIELEKIEIVGKYISDQKLYLLILSIWGFFGLVLFIHVIYSIRWELRQAARRQQELEAVNDLLNVKQHRLEKIINKDPLTGVLNRAGMNDILARNSNQHQLLTLSLMFIDIDHFKQVNDRFGHNMGDEVLVFFARLLEQNIRELDILARWGGEEFILVCPNTDIISAATLAEKLRIAIEQAPGPSGINITVSIGVAEMRKESREEFIGRADKALYQAKATGRNKVVLAQ